MLVNLRRTSRNEHLIESIIRDHPELAKDRTLLKQYLSYKGYADDALKVFEYLNLVKAGGMLSKVQAALSRLSVPGLSELMFIIDTLYNIGAANRWAVKIFGHKAYAYGVTSWAFRHPPAADFKLIVRLRFRNQPKRLAQAVFTGFEAGMSGFEQEAHSKLRCDYPN